MFRSAVLCLALVFSAVPAVLRAEPFFPPGTFGPARGNWTPAGLDAFMEGWFGGALSRFSASPLWPAGATAPDETVLRVMAVPSFSQPALITLTFPSGGQAEYLSQVFRTEPQFQLEPQTELHQSSGPISSADKAEILALLAQLPPLNGQPKAKDPENIICLDGTTFVFELASPGRYAALELHQCFLNPGTPARALIELLDQLSGGRRIKPQAN